MLTISAEPALLQRTTQAVDSFSMISMSLQRLWVSSSTTMTSFLIWRECHHTFFVADDQDENNVLHEQAVLIYIKLNYSKM